MKVILWFMYVFGVYLIWNYSNWQTAIGVLMVVVYNVMLHHGYLKEKH